MERALWEELPEKMIELEQDRKELMDLKSKMNKISGKGKNEESFGTIDYLMLTLEVCFLVGGFISWGLWGVIANLGCTIFPSAVVGACKEWWQKRIYFKEAPILQDQIEKAEKQNKEKYVKEKWDQWNEFIVRNIFSAEAIKYISELIIQQEYDMELAIETYYHSEHYRQNLVKINSEKNSMFLEMIWEEK